MSPFTRNDEDTSALWKSQSTRQSRGHNGQSDVSVSVSWMRTSTIQTAMRRSARGRALGPRRECLPTSRLHELGGPLIAAMLIVAGELRPRRALAIYAPRQFSSRCTTGASPGRGRASPVVGCGRVPLRGRQLDPQASWSPALDASGTIVKSWSGNPGVTHAHSRYGGGGPRARDLHSPSRSAHKPELFCIPATAAPRRSP